MLKRATPATHGSQYQNLSIMSVCILNDAPSILRRNEQKITICARAKVALKWGPLEEITQGHEEVTKPPLVKFVSKILLKILKIFN